MRYLKVTRTIEIIYENNKSSGNLIIKGYFDSNWVSDQATKKSTSDFIFMLNDGPISWCLKRQTMVAFSSTEVEYVALTFATEKAT